MGKSVVRLGDYCAETSQHICTGGSDNVFVNGKPVCRLGDSFTENKTLIQGSATVFANGFGIARVGDLVSCGFKIANGSGNVFSGKT
ncbi:PAAR domain-containing protein [Candidatus Mesenet endosymbiont of Agriotes lineatus]|uniref:PAAR domain-containing protein n=1 Tax=Candidatus Mesenet endosymbiont of Agriotes lineatus TaxID=3077948 RepID=UPI0030D073D7